MTLASTALGVLPRWLWPRPGDTQDHKPQALTGAAAIDPHHPHTTWESQPFIPVSRFVIAEKMANTGAWGDTKPETLLKLFRYISAWRHVVYKERLDDLEQVYLPFSPETDLLRIGTYSPAKIADHRRRFIAGIKRLLRQANYLEVPRELIPRLMARETVHGLALHVDLDDFEECTVYRRGTDYAFEKRRSIWTLYLWPQEFRVPVYQRLAVVLKLWPEEARITQVMAARSLTREQAQRMVRRSRSTLPAGIDSDRIYVKLFRDIPSTDLEMLFPNTHVRFSRADKIRLGGSAAGGIVLGIFGAVSNLETAVLSPYALVVAGFGLGAIVFRQLMGFLNQRTQYMKVLAENLYFRSLADNRSAFTLLANRAEEEDVKEEILLYASLATREVHRKDLPAVKAEISNYLQSEFSVDVAFDLYDALERLMRDGIVSEGADGRMRALEPMAALERFDTMWHGYLQPHGKDRHLLDEDPALR